MTYEVQINFGEKKLMRGLPLELQDSQETPWTSVSEVFASKLMFYYML